MPQAASAQATRDQARLQVLNDVLAPARRTRIVDIGANPINPAPYDVLADAGLADIFGFEPQQSAYEALLANPLPNRTYLPYAIGNGQPGVLYECAHSGFTSLLEPGPEIVSLLGRWKDHLTVVAEHEIETRRLDDVEEIQSADFLKIDVQGAELAVFQNAHKTLANAVAVMTEVAAIPIYKDQPLIHEQMRELHQLGFMLHKFDFFKDVHVANSASPRLKLRHHSNQLVDGDGIFMRSLLHLDQLGSEQLKHLAILSDGVFRSFDLVVKIMDILRARGAISSVVLVDRYINMLPSLRRQAKQVVEPAAVVEESTIDVSAIVIAYNNEDYIEDALLSAINQSPAFKEIIVVDDCSTDATAEIIARICGPNERLTVIRHEKNSGPGAARNTGIEQVTSVRFCFLDGDDRFYENATKSIQDAIADAPSADMLMFRGMSFFPDGRKKKIGGVDPGIYETLQDKRPVFHSGTYSWNKLYRRRWINRSGIRFPNGKYEDIPWCYECTLKANKIAAFDAPVIWYRRHPTSTLQRRSEHQLDVLAQWKSTLIRMQEHPEMSDTLLRFIEVNGFLQMSRMLLRDKIPQDRETEFAHGVLDLVGPLPEIRSGLSIHPEHQTGLKLLRGFRRKMKDAAK